MVLIVLTIFALGTTARWRAVRADRREARRVPPAATTYATTGPAAAARSGTVRSPSSAKRTR